jgi:hypothetical protein
MVHYNDILANSYTFQSGYIPVVPNHILVALCFAYTHRAYIIQIKNICACRLWSLLLTWTFPQQRQMHGGGSKASSCGGDVTFS